MTKRADKNFVLIQVVIYAEQIKAGAKPTAQVGCQRAELEEISDFCRREGLEICVQQVDVDRLSVWIFRDKYLRLVIEEFSKAEPPTIPRVWVMGKLFGYSDSEIAKFIEGTAELEKEITALREKP